jgi:hypothetical protein
MGKKNKAPEAKHGDKPCASKQKQQSSLLASAVPTTEMSKKSKAVAAEATPSSCPPHAEAATGNSSAMNVVENNKKIATQPKYVAVSRVPPMISGSVSVELVAEEEVL